MTKKKCLPSLWPHLRTLWPPKSLSKSLPSKDKPKRQPTQGNHTTEDAVFDALCSATGTNQTLTSHTCAVSLDHHLYNNLNNRWSKQASSPSQQQSTQMITIPWDSHPSLSNLIQQPLRYGRHWMSKLFG